MKLQFLSAKDSALASVEKPELLENVRKEFLSREGCVEVSDPNEADAIVLHEAWSFKTQDYLKRLHADPVAGRYPQKLLTINGDDAATGLLRGVYASIAQRLFDPLLHRAVPYHYLPNTAVSALAEKSPANPAPTLLAAWRGNLKSSALRTKLLKAFGGHPRFRIETSESWLDHSRTEMEHYVELVISSKFSLCPTGWAAATFRIYESMALGICPVIMADEFVPPQGPEWDAFAVKVPEKRFMDLESILQEKEPQAMEMGQLGRKAWERYFCPSVIYRYYVDALLECYHLPGERTPEAEFRRWNSWKTHWTNRWTVPQRITTRLARMTRR
jgi:hypothetical protein